MTGRFYPWQLLLATSLGSLLVSLNMSTLNVALPELVNYFKAGPVASSWILISYMLFFAIFILIFGKLSDIYGRRKLYLFGLIEFTVVSLLCGLAPNVGVLIVLRVLQAIGGAIVITNTTPLITEAFSEEKLGNALGINVVVSSVAQMLGPVVGGYMVHVLDWRWVFWFNVPVGLIGIVWAFYIIKPSPGKASGDRIDIPGNIAIVFGLGGLIYAFMEGGTNGWASVPVTVGLLMFAVFALFFAWWEQRAKYPAVDFKLFRDRAFAMANVATFLNSVARSSVVLLIALFYQVIFQENTFDAGLRVLPVTIGVIVASPIVGRLSGKYSALALSTSGLFLSFLGMLLLSVNIGENASDAWINLGQFMVGFGSGVFMTPNTKSIMLTVPAHARGMANGLRSMLQNMGTVISTALSLMLVTSVLPERLKEAIYQGASAGVGAKDAALITGGFRVAFLTMMAFTILAIVMSYLRKARKKNDASPERPITTESI